MRFLSVLPVLAALLPGRRAASTSDSLQDADAPQSGYLPHHNIDPAKLSSYTMNWTAQFITSEMFYAKPLTFTPTGSSVERVVVVSNMNYIRVLDSFTGKVLLQRQVRPPFNTSDITCGDMPNNVGIAGTPVIDAATEIVYFYSKGYKGDVAGPQGVANGEYKLYALNLADLTDVPGFPVTVDGRYANNDNARYFLGGTSLQRPGLVMLGDSIVAGFGSHCNNYNVTGFLITASKTAGVGITNIQAMVASPGAPVPQALDITNQGNGKSGIWMSGTGLALDEANSRVFIVTGNGGGPGQLKGSNGVPTSGSTYLSTVEDTAASYRIAANGSLVQNDWFAPYNYDNWNGGDRDFGSAGISLLDPATFSGGGVNRVAIAGGKTGKLFVLDADNMGGFLNGENKGDAVLQNFTVPGSFFGGYASYPGEGGYLYFCPTGGPLYAYKFSMASGKPSFVAAGQSPALSSNSYACKGPPVVTSLNGQEGTAVVWLADVNIGVVPYSAVPVDGVLQRLTFPATGRLTKFHRPAFGNTRVYATLNNKILCYAPPGPLPEPPSTISQTSSTRTSTSAFSQSSAFANSTTTLTTFSTSSTSASVTSSFLDTTTLSTSSTSTSSTSASSTSPASFTSPASTSPSTSPTSTTTSATSTTTTAATTSLSSTLATSSTLSTSTTSKSTTSTSQTSSYVSPTPTRTNIVSLRWNISWVNAAPDGHARPYIGINGQWPIPPLVAKLGDELKIQVTNSLGNQTTSMHFHGLFMKGYTYADGAAFVSQCPIPPGQTIVQQFVLTQVGTYWFHSHDHAQYMDGLRGVLVVKDPSAPYGKVDNDVVLSLSDLYHDEAPNLIHHYLSSNNSDATGGAEPSPDSTLINDAQNVQIAMAPGNTTLFRVVNMGAAAAQYLTLEGHDMTVVEIDGQYVTPYTVSQLFVAVSQRYAVIVHSKDDATANYRFTAVLQTRMFVDGSLPSGSVSSATGYLVYDSTKTLPSSPFTPATSAWDDSVFTPLDRESLYGPVTLTISIGVTMATNEQNQIRGLINGVTYLAQKIPTLYTVLTAPASVVNNSAIYGANSVPFILPYGAVVEVTIDNHDDRAHPFHLHGHYFQVISRSDGGSLFPGMDSTPTVPMKRDTVVVYAQGSTTIRFVADNPGVWLFHCHTEWHMESGMAATFIEAPAELQAAKPYIPVSHRDICDRQGISRKGNAGGNWKSWLDLTNANTKPPTEAWGALIT